MITDEQAGYGQIEHRSLLESIASRDLQINQLKGQIAELQGQIEKLGVELEAMRSKNA